MKSKTRYTPETVRVSPVDMEKLNKMIDEFFHKDGAPANKTFRTSGVVALMRQPKLCIINDEFIGHDVGEGTTFTYYVYEEEDLGNGHHTGHCFPTHELTLTLEELSPYLKPEVSLAEFTKERRGYNSRIRGNEAEWVRYLNK